MSRLSYVSPTSSSQLRDREREKEETDAVAHTISVGYGWSFISCHSLTLSEGEKSSAHIHQTTVHHRQTTAKMTPNHISPLKVVIIYSPSCQTCMWKFFNGKQNSKNIIQSHQDLEGLFFQNFVDQINKFTAVFKIIYIRVLMTVGVVSIFAFNY